MGMAEVEGLREGCEPWREADRLAEIGARDGAGDDPTSGGLDGCREGVGRTSDSTASGR